MRLLTLCFWQNAFPHGSRLTDCYLFPVTKFQSAALELSFCDAGR
ncbi:MULTISPECIES: hypothetical protein [Providencia]|nr:MULTISPECIES: hypothetical protein [Providencia]